MTYTCECGKSVERSKRQPEGQAIRCPECRRNLQVELTRKRRQYTDPRPKPVGRVSMSRVDRLAVLYRELEQAEGGADPGAFLRLASEFAELRAHWSVSRCERMYKECVA